jgi:cytoskeletal protein CcmA (bactofilin family)
MKNIFVFIFILIISFIGKSQTTLLSPTGDGGFETGTSFALNNWTVVNAATNNFWVCGTGATAYAGSRGAYIASTGTTYAYVTTASKTSHMYRDLIIPSGATNINLSFYWKGKGESGYDRLLVYTAANTVTPVAGTPASSSTTLTGATLQWTQPSYAVTTYTAASITLPNSLAGTTVRIIFTWQNDASLGTSPGAAVDNIGLVYTPPCSGTPIAGTSSATITSGCSGISTTFNSSGVSTSTGISYIWQSSSDNTTFSNISGATSSSYPTTLPSGTMYYRIKSTCSNGGGVNYSTSTSVTGSICVTMPASGSITSTGCSGTLYDPSGTGSYGNSVSSTITLYPSGAGNKVRLTFTSFSTESNYDGLMIYNGNNTSSPIISSGAAVGSNSTTCPAGAYSGTTSPGTITSTATDGSLTLFFQSDGSTTSTGFDATISCFTPPAPSCVSSPTSPSNGATGVTVVPTLTWSAITYAESYDVYFGAGSLPGTPTTNVTGTSYTPTTLNPLTTYYWKIVPKNTTGLATGCSTWSFTTMSPQYATSWVSMNTGSSSWCAGETRNITVTVKNNGSQPWDDAVADFNLGVKWNADGDYYTRVDVQNLAAGATQTFTLTVTAPLTTGTNNLTFDVVRESCFWFATNVTACGVTAGPGNTTYTSSVVTIYPYPASQNAGVDATVCLGQSTQLSGTASLTTTLHTANSNSDFTSFTTNDATRWSVSSTANSGGTSPELAFAYVSSVTSTMWVKSPQLNATSYSSLSLSFKQYCDWYTGSFILRLQTSTDNSTWTDRWNSTVTADVAATTTTVSLNALAGTNFYYRFMFDGYTWNINNWYIDDISITGSPILTYSWSPSTGLSNSNIYNPTSSPSSTTTYTMSVSYNGCVVTDQIQVAVNQPSITNVNNLIDPDLVNGDYVWNGLNSTSWNIAGNWYIYNSSSNLFDLGTQNPLSSSTVYILPNTTLGSCISSTNTPSLDITDNITNLNIYPGQTLTISNPVNIAGNLNINGNIAGNSTIILSGTSNQNIAGNTPTIPNLQINKITGDVTLQTPIKISGTLTMTQGNINTTSTNILEIGTSTSTLGSVSWSSGTVNGPMKRWFTNSINSTQSSGIFPIGSTIPSKGVLNRYAQVNFTSAPSSGGYIVAEYKTG